MCLRMYASPCPLNGSACYYCVLQMICLFVNLSLNVSSFQQMGNSTSIFFLHLA